MIYGDKQPLPDDPTPADAPPSYDELNDAPAAESSYPAEKPSAYPSSSPPTLPYTFVTNSQISPLPSIKSPVPPNAQNKTRRSWFTFGQSSRVLKEVKATIIDLLRDIVKQPDSSSATSILESCVEASHSYGLSLSSVLQERCIEGHSPLYWAVINRPAMPPNPNIPDFLSALMSQAAPLSDATISDLRLACLQNSDQALFQRLKRSPAFSPVTGTEEMIFGESVTPDEIEVLNIPGDEGAFVTQFRIPMFQKRMRISQEICLEFIARGMCLHLCAFCIHSQCRISIRLSMGVKVLHCLVREQIIPTWGTRFLERVFDVTRTQPACIHRFPPRYRRGTVITDLCQY